MNPQPALTELQRWLLGAVVNPSGVTPQTLAEHVLPGAQLDAAACVAVYQRSYGLRLRKCLIEQFPATYHALGESLFCDFADAYLQACPSDSYTLYELGRRFPDWLDHERPDRGSDVRERETWIDFLVDLARYERGLFRLFDAQGHEGQVWPDAQADDDSLVLQPCLSLATYRYPVAAYYHAVREQRQPGYPPPIPSHVVMLRRDYQMATYPVSEFHMRFLVALQQRGQVAAALEAVAAEAQRPFRLVTQSWQTEVKRQWITAGFFVTRQAMECTLGTHSDGLDRSSSIRMQVTPNL